MWVRCLCAAAISQASTSPCGKITPQCIQPQIDDSHKVAGKSGDTGAEIQYGSSLCGFWGGSFCESREQHHEPRGSAASLCVQVWVHTLNPDWSKFSTVASSRLFSVSPALQGQINVLNILGGQLDYISHLIG